MKLDTIFVPALQLELADPQADWEAEAGVWGLEHEF